MRSMLSNNGQPDDRSELIVPNNMSQLLLATGWNLDDDGHHDTAMQNRWSALNGPINWRKQTKKTKHNPKKFSHQCTPKPVANKNDMKMRVVTFNEETGSDPFVVSHWRLRLYGLLKLTEYVKLSPDKNTPTDVWEPSSGKMSNSLAWTRCFFKQKHGILSLHRPTNSMVMANYGRRGCIC